MAFGRWRDGHPGQLAWAGPPADGEIEGSALTTGRGGRVALMWSPSGTEDQSVFVLAHPLDPAATTIERRYPSAGQQPLPAVAITPRGTTVTAWAQRDGIHARWGSHQQRVAGYANGGNYLAVQASSDATVLGSWIDARGRLRLARARPGRRPVDEVVTTRINGYGTPPSLAAVGRRMAIVWVDRLDRVWARVGHTTGPLSRPVRVGRMSGYAWPVAAIDARGRTHIAAPTSRELWAATLSPRGRLTKRHIIIRTDDCDLLPLLAAPGGRHFALTAYCRRPVLSVLEAE